MKISNINPGVLAISSILTAIGTGAVLGFLFQKNRHKISIHEARRLEKGLFKKLKEQGKDLKNKVKGKIDSSKAALEDLSN